MRTRCWSTAVLVAILAGGTGWAAPGEVWRVLYDSALVLTRPVATPQEQTLIERAARPSGVSQATWRLLARVPGPFLKAGTQETALLYGVEFDPEFRLLVVRAGRPVLHAKLTPGAGLSGLREAYALQDINRDGLRELALVQMYGENGYGDEWLTVLDLAGGWPNPLHRFQTYTARCDPDDPDRWGTVRRYRLLVKPGPMPTFQATVSGKDTCQNVPERPLPGSGAPPSPDLKLARLTVTPLQLP